MNGFFALTKPSSSHDLDGVGELAVYQEMEQAFSWQLMFTRCHVVVKMYIIDDVDIDDIINYAGNLDQRITPIVCE